jgi:hypothetical protein
MNPREIISPKDIKNIPRNCIKLNLKLILKCSRERQRIAMILNVRIT